MKMPRKKDTAKRRVRVSDDSNTTGLDGLVLGVRTFLGWRWFNARFASRPAAERAARWIRQAIRESVANEVLRVRSEEGARRRRMKTNLFAARGIL